MNDYIVTMTNGDADYDQVLVQGVNSEHKAAIKAEEDYGRRGWHHARVKLIQSNKG